MKQILIKKVVGIVEWPILVVLIIPYTVGYIAIKLATAAYYNGKFTTLNRQGERNGEEE